MAKTILFSGRFDKFHAGHIMTIAELGAEYDKVIVCVLDYPEQFYPIKERYDFITNMLDKCKGNYEVVINSVNFENITREDVETLPNFDVYGTGNTICYLCMSALGYIVLLVPRTRGYAASTDRQYQKLIKFLEDEGFLK